MRADDLRRELRNPQAVYRGRTPRLVEFAEDWGTKLLPSAILAEPPDVLVITPHGWLHDLPLHLVQCNGRPFGTVCGVSYTSSHALFIRCTERNKARGVTDTYDPDTSPKWSDPIRRRKVVIAVADVQRADNKLFNTVADNVAAAFCPADSVIIREAHVSTAEMTQNDGQEAADMLCLIAHGWIDSEERLSSGLLVLDVPATSYFSVRAHDLSFQLRVLPFAEPPPGLDLARPATLLTAAQLELFFESRQELILLLGCSAGSGSLRRGDQPASLAEIFLQCGAASVVAPLWDIDTNSTSLWAQAFLNAWHRGGMPKALAARYALDQLHAKGSGLQKAGALTLRGDWL